MNLDDRRERPALSRREALGSLAALLGSGLALEARADPGDEKARLATFEADVTPPLGHACMGGGIAPVKRVDDPLFAKGFVLTGPFRPIVVVVVDWCEIRNDAHSRWRSALAEAAGTDPARVLVASVHQHDAPVADLDAERILHAHKAAGSVCDLAFHEQTVQRVADALRQGLRTTKAVSHVGLGQAKVERVASNRRFLTVDGKVSFSRTSASHDPRAHEQPEGTIDPWLKTLSFWDGDRPLLAMSVYATHPMSYYGQGAVSSDFVGLARQRRQKEEPDVLQIYASGCSGNVTAGKYNEGTVEDKSALTDRMHSAMTRAWEATRRQPIGTVGFRSVSFRLEPRDDPGFTVEDLTKRLTTDPKPFGQCLAALGLSWRKRCDAGAKLDLPVLDLGPAQVVLLPGESYIEYQLLAQRLRPDSFVLTLGYGECATGYVPTEKAVNENDTNLHDWCWVAPGAEQVMTDALTAALKSPA
ncbi:MAG: hypothetical protein ABI353_16365 [Isosphaeraceae bacterium]